jgi:hypothetical protein
METGHHDPAVVNLFVNGYTITDLFDFAVPGFPANVDHSVPDRFLDEVFSLLPSNREPQPVVGLQNNLVLEKNAASPANYRLTRVGIAPLDVRIEAFIYAQENSFFILPGPWFNPDPNDTYEGYVNERTLPGGATSLPRYTRAGEDQSLAGDEVNPLFPFYRQPMDVRITIFGGVAENLPAAVGDQGAWMEKWGWVPRYYGSTGLPTFAGPNAGAAEATMHGANGPQLGSTPGTGLTYEFNDYGLLPYLRQPNAPDQFVTDANGLPVPVRSDVYGRTLPIVPRLPVARDLLYFGESPIR